MPITVRLIAFAAIFCTLVSGTARISAEKGTRAHRTRLAAGDTHTCAILDDGSVWCWGIINGHLSDGTSFPVRVTRLTSSISIAAGDQHNCAVASDGSVSCWGANDSGQLGNGTNTQSATPVPVSGLANVISIAAGYAHTCAVRTDGTVWCWGSNSFGELGNGTKTSSNAPVQVSNLTAAVSVTAGSAHTCALRGNGTVACWGSGVSGELGNGSTGLTFITPVQTAPLSPTAGVGAVDVSAAGAFTCALLSDGSVSCWGDNTTGQLGDGTFTPKSVPTRSALPGIAVGLSARFQHVCAILANGSVDCWGSDSLGELGDGGRSNQPQPVSVAGVSGVVEIAGGSLHTCATTVAGAIQCWGDNTRGQHANGNTLGAATDFVLNINGTFLARGVTAGNQFTCAHRGNGAAVCWGLGDQGQLGNSGNTSSSVPVAVTGLTINTIAISAGNGAHGCALDVTSAAFCWGDNSRGQLGNGSLAATSRPIPVTGGLQFVAISAGDLHTCGLIVGGTVACWGAGDKGQIGNGGTSDSALPIQVSGIQNAMAVSAGSGFACALIVDGSVRCWGDNRANELGDGGTESFSSVPKPVGGLGGVASISAGMSHACAVVATGPLFCWGSNVRGQIGNNSTAPASVPTFVALPNAVTTSAGAFFTCATRVDGTAACWGANDNGELSTTDGANHLTPATVFSGLHPVTRIAQIVTGTGITRVSFSVFNREHACMLMANGTIFCWGANTKGEVGNGTTVGQISPVAVNSFVANIDPAAKLLNGRIAKVTALIDCQARGQALIILTLSQGAATGTGHAEAECSGALSRVPMTIPAQGPLGWQPGAATAQVEAIILNETDRLIDDTHWTRQVFLSAN